MQAHGDGTQAGDVTRLLDRVRDGDRDALDRILPLVYDELRNIAGGQLRRERDDHTLDATEIVHEAFLRLRGSDRLDVRDRAHFLGIAARSMRQVLVDHARRRSALKRGGDRQRTTLSGHARPVSVSPEELLDLDRALERLDALDPRLRKVVEYRYFGGMTDREIGEVLGVTRRTVQRDWARARAWLYREIYRDAPPAGDGAG
jgi:RNA polymerase sigma factor (TIGR02999 family)